MELASIMLARVLAWVEPHDLNPKGGIFFPDLTKALVGRYNFQKFPQTLEEFDQTKGVTFAAGISGNTVIDNLVLYTYGLTLDTTVSTQESRRLLEEALEWGKEELGLRYKPSMISRWNYASQLTFYSKVPLTGISPALQRLADGVTKSVGEMTQESLQYELISFHVDHDQLNRKHPLGAFSIQRRDNTPFSENKYFSNAPLPTDIHTKLLEQFEADLSNK
jgi:hypothetical protein